MCANAAPAAQTKQLLQPFVADRQSMRIPRTTLAKPLLCR